MDHLSDWLMLHHALGGTPRTVRLLLEQFASPKEILELHQKNPQALTLTPLQRQRFIKINKTLIDDDLKWASTDAQHHIITLHDPNYPNDLKEIYDPPIILYVKGNPACLHRPQLAIVGSRNPSYHGEQSAYTFARALGDAGLIITSGLAIGIDHAAHQGALDSTSQTIAVLGSGINIIYPKKHLSLSHEIALTGAIISENPINTPPIAANFPKRNRIISGLSLGTLVVEAALQSGSLVTARLANEQGRDVFAIPGNINSPLSRGCHYLIKNGAKLTETVEDILGEFELKTKISLKPLEVSRSKILDPLDNKLLECLGLRSHSVQELIYLSGVSAKDMSARLLNLELHGYIKTAPGGYCTK